MVMLLEIKGYLTCLNIDSQYGKSFLVQGVKRFSDIPNPLKEIHLYHLSKMLRS